MPQHTSCSPRRSHLYLRFAFVTCALAALGGCQSMPPATDLRHRVDLQATSAVAPGQPETSPTSQMASIPDGHATSADTTLSQVGEDQAPDRGLPTAAIVAPPKDLWERLRRGMKLQPAAGVAVQRTVQHVRWYREQGSHIKRTFLRARLYLYDIVEAVEREGMPMEIALLPAVESAFMPTARSSAAADGLWQFIAPTGRRFNLKQHMFQDDRRNVRAATQAALRYLNELQARYGGDYQLALAAYNCGEGCIDAAIRRAKARGLPGRFEDLNLVPETANYVPKLLALAQVVAAAVDLGELDAASLPAMANAPYFAAVGIRRDIDVKLAAQLAGLSIEDFRALNAQHKTPVIVAAANTEVLVPVERQATLEEALLNYRGPLATWGAAQVAKRSSVDALARQHGMDAGMLRQVNGIPSGHLVSGGSTVLVARREAHQDITGAAAEGATLATTPAMARAAVHVARKENWVGLAGRLGVTVKDLRGWNPKVATLRAGLLQLTLPVDLAERAKQLTLPPKPSAAVAARASPHLRTGGQTKAQMPASDGKKPKVTLHRAKDLGAHRAQR